GNDVIRAPSHSPLRADPRPPGRDHHDLAGGRARTPRCARQRTSRPRRSRLRAAGPARTYGGGARLWCHRTATEGRGGAPRERPARRDERSAARDARARRPGGLRVGGLKVRTAYGVPLAEAGTVFGVAHVGSLTADDLARADRHLVATILARAVPAIHQRVLADGEERAARELVMLRTVVDHT